MSRRERTIVYTLLALLLVMNLPTLVGSSAADAFAAGRAWLQDLGPAASLTLEGDGDDGSVTLRAADGRLSWKDGAPHRTMSTAFVHIGAVMNQLLDAELFEEERTAFREEREEEENAFQERARELDAVARDMSPEDEGAQAMVRQMQELEQEYARWRRDQQAALGRLASSQVERAYRDLVAAVDVVAERRDIDLVYRFVPTARAFEAMTPDVAEKEVFLRTALHYPAELDITNDVLEELSLELE